jgi:acyl-CoA synthetase (AMP-forming)/AMP-acid ligase II
MTGSAAAGRDGTRRVDSAGRPTLWQLALRTSRQFAFISTRGNISGAEICRHATSLAGVLREEVGTAGESLVTVATGSPAATVVALLAVSALGTHAAIVGPTGEMATSDVIGRLAPTVVVHDGGTTSLSGMAGREVRLDSRTGAVATWRRTGSANGEWLQQPAVDEQPFHGPFLLFRTSGTSGPAKWVVHTEASVYASLESKLRGMGKYGSEQGLSAEARSVVEAVAGAPRAVLIALTTISGYTQLMHCLALGVPLVATSGFLPRRALRLTSETGAGTLVVTPAMLQVMTKIPKVRRLAWDCLGVVGLGGSHVRPELVTTAEETFGTLVVQGYGSTELGGGVVNVRIYDSAEVRAQTVGRPLGGVEVRIVRPDGSWAAVGEAGEILVRAPDRLAAGYVVAEAPLRVVPLDLRDGFHATGDVGMLRADRNLVVTGRLGNQISRGDESFSPHDVEAVIETHPGVLRARVTSGIVGGKVVVRAACEVYEGQEVDAAEIRGWCRSRMSRARCPDLVEITVLD